MKKKTTIPTIIGIIVLALGSIAGVLVLNKSQIFSIGADASLSAKNIRVSNISDTSVTVSWTTDKATTDYLTWGASQSNIDKIVEEDSSQGKYFNHSINVTGLAPGTKYYYKINSDGTSFDNSGIPWQFTTGPSIPDNKDSVLVSGSVINATGSPEKHALVYADIGGYLLATITSDTGNYVFQIGSARTNDLQKYVTIDNTKTLIQLSVQAGVSGVASAQIYPQSANPVPPIIIGQTYDFRNEPANSTGANPSANLNLPQDNSKASKFDVTLPNETPKPTSVILESLTEGEVVTSTQPEFFGKGPSGTNLTITVHSENPITADVQIPKNGSWSYAVPSNLAPGNHSITISWVDVSGITRFLTRDFVVQAGEVPAFTASGSGATATPKATVTPKPSGSPVATISPAPTVTPEASATAMPVPVTGDFTPTIVLFIISIAVMMFTFAVWKIAEN